VAGDNVNFFPLFRSSIGFDRTFNLLGNAGSFDVIDSRPDYDILKIGEDDYRITVAVAGPSQDEPTLAQEQ
jgi:molecular chaperone IbpA